MRCPKCGYRFSKTEIIVATQGITTKIPVPDVIKPRKKGKAKGRVLVHLNWEGRGYCGNWAEDAAKCLDKILEHAVGPIQWCFDPDGCGPIFVAPAKADVVFQVSSGCCRELKVDRDRYGPDTLYRWGPETLQYLEPVKSGSDLFVKIAEVTC